AQKRTIAGRPLSDSVVTSPPIHFVAPPKLGIGEPLRSMPGPSAGLHHLLAGFPIRGAKPTRLQRCQHAERLFDRAADVERMDNHVLEHAARIDDEEAAERDVRPVDEDAEAASDFTAVIRAERITEAGDAILFARRLDPCAVRENGIRRDAEQARPKLVE